MVEDVSYLTFTKYLHDPLVQSEGLIAGPGGEVIFLPCGFHSQRPCATFGGDMME